MERSRTFTWCLYALPLIVLPAIAVVLWRWPPTAAYLNWVPGSLGFVTGCWALAHSIGEGRRQRDRQRPDLAGHVFEIKFSSRKMANGSLASPPNGIVTFELAVRNRGGQETTISACFLVMEGGSRENARSLYLTPQRLIVKARSEERLTTSAMAVDAESLRNLNGMLLLRDATDREYPVEVKWISPGARGQAIAALDVRTD